MMKNKVKAGVLIPVFATFYVMGFVDLVGMATGYVKQDFGLSDSLAQLLPSMVFLWFALPFTYVVITTPIMYNNFRQFIFITPPFFVFAAYALQFLHDHLKQRVILPLALSFVFVLGLLNLFSLHPYQYIYYNQFTGGVRGAFRSYDLDYLYISLKEAIEYINEIAPEGAQILVWDVEYPQAIMYNRPDITINRVAHISEAEYPSYQYAVIPTTRNVDLGLPEWWEPIHTISRNGADLVIIYEINSK